MSKINAILVILMLLTQVNISLAENTFVQTTYDDPDWVLVTSDLMLRENICSSDFGSAKWYEKVFNPCFFNENRYWKLEPFAETGEAFTLEQLSIEEWSLDSLYVREGFGFQLYYNTEEPNDPNDLLPATPWMTGPQYVTLTHLA